MSPKGFIGLPILIAIMAVLVVAGGGTAYYLTQQNKDQVPEPAPTGVPATVLAAYEAKAKWMTEVGSYFPATLELCTKGSQTIYNVTWSGGFAGGDEFFDTAGTSLGTLDWDDVGPPNNKSSIAINEYTCTTLKKSK